MFNFLQIVKSYLFPFEKNERKKVFLLSSLVFLLLFNKNIISSVRDSLIAIEGCSEILSFIKIWFEFPLSLLLVFLYHKLYNKIPEGKLFAAFLFLFMVLYLIIGFILIPNAETIHPSYFIVNKLLIKFPHYYGFIIIWSKWTIVFFYILNEIWTTLTYTLMFWQLVSNVVDIKEQPKYFIYLNMVGQLNLLGSGKAIFFLSRFVNNHFSDKNALIKISVFIFAVFATIAIFLEKSIIKKSNLKNIELLKKSTSKKKISVIKAIKILFNSEHIKYLCLMSICYSAVIANIEGLAMCMTKKYFNSISEYCKFQGQIIFYIGIFCIVLGLFGKFIVKKYNWYTLAIITPMTSFITGVYFFCSVILHQHNIIRLKIVVGSVLLLFILIKSTKYTFFDSARAIAYTKIPKELEADGRAVIAFLGDNVGRSLGSIFQLIIFSTIQYSQHEDIVIYLFVFFLFFSVVWFNSTYFFDKITNKVIN